MTTATSRSLRSLAQTLTVAFLLLSVVTLAADGLITLYNNVQRQRESISAQQQSIAQNASREVGGFFEEKYKVLEEATEIIELPRGSVEQKTLILQSLLATQPSFRQAVLLDASGAEAAQASRVSLEPSTQFISELQGTLRPGGQAKRYISPLYYDAVTDEPLIVLAIPVNIWDFNGTLAAEVNLQFMWTLVDQLKVGQTGYVYIVDAQGNLVASRETARVLAGENVSQISEVNEFVSNPAEASDITPEIESYTGLLGKQVFGTYIPLGTPQWAVVTELPAAEANEPISQTIRSSLLTILVMGILAGLAGSIVARRLSIPLTNLTGTATRIANGELHLQAVGGGASEIAGLATAFNTMTSQLQGLIDNLENRVLERTQDLEKANEQTSRRAVQLQAITELGESIAQVQDLGELFPNAARLISERFGFYHVGIFLVDSDKEYAILQAANSEGGQQMLARGHRLKLGTGIVGFAARSGQPRIALDVGADAVFFDNPDLPNTRSEVALPMKSRGEIMGVLDVQSTEAEAFSREDLQVLGALANQVSIALENARLLTETRAALAQVQEVYDEFTRAEWNRTNAQIQQSGFRYQSGRIEMLDGVSQTPEIASALRDGKAVVRSDSQNAAVTVPVKLRGEVIGVLQVDSNDPAKTWQESEITLMEAVAERAAFALENARLFQDARRRATKESVISEATARISGALNIENILQTTAEELERILGGSDVVIQFQNRENS